MYKIVIADDEKIVRDGIKKLINWELLGLELVGDAENGKDTYDLIKKYKPDIAMIDINMPQIDGLKLIKMLKEEKIKCEIVIVTGYDEFNYAREALRLGVNDYILKPVTKNELQEILGNLVKELKTKKDNLNEIDIKIHESILFQEYRFLNGLIYGDLALESCDNELTEYMLLCNYNLYTIAILDMDELLKTFDRYEANERKLSQFALFNITSELMHKSNNGIAFKTEENEIAILFYSQNEDPQTALKEFEDTLVKIKEYCRDNLKNTVSIGIGILVKDIKEISKSYFKAKNAIECRFFIGNDALIYGIELDGKYKMSIDIISEIESSLLRFIKELEDENVIKESNSLSRYMKLQRLNKNKCVDEWAKLILLMFQFFQSVNIDIMKVIENNYSVYEIINGFKTIDDIKDHFINTYKTCSNYIKTHSDTNKIYILNMKAFLEKNYSDEELSFQNLCNYIHLSPSYLATIFKNELGKTYIEYLTDIRVQKSLELLKNTNLKVYEIANKVGYSNQHYFSSLFKKMLGESPSDYRNKINNI